MDEPKRRTAETMICPVCLTDHLVMLGPMPVCTNCRKAWAAEWQLMADVDAANQEREDAGEEWKS